ncbi:alpha/beta hydrolase family protein [Bacillus massilinigeriensis]|uniref:hypothetical protein n=1 Tax=Bacillus mediterraneensis TaxID=1805474 RepID=UPI0008F7FF20|nr:hypothetical protein [Bacillus mediterraneensis]
MGNSIQDEIYHIMSNRSYRKPEKDISITLNGQTQKWNLVDVKNDKDTGLHAVAYKHENNIIIAYRGTQPDSWKDLKSDLTLIVNDIEWLTPKKNQFTESVKFAKKIQKDHPNMYISTTGHSLGSADSQYASAVLGLDSVTFSGPAILHSLPPELQKAAKDGKFDKTHTVYIDPRDPVSAGPFTSWKTWGREHIGTVYALGKRYDQENFGEGTKSELDAINEYHGIKKFEFDEYGNIVSDIFTDIKTNKEYYRSPHFMGSVEAGSIQLTPEILLDRADDLNKKIREVEERHDTTCAELLSYSHIEEAQHVESLINREMNGFINWYGEHTTDFVKVLREAAKTFVEADKLQ